MLNAAEGEFTMQQMLIRQSSRERTKFQEILKQISRILSRKDVKFSNDPEMYAGLKIETPYWTAKFDLVEFDRKDEK